MLLRVKHTLKGPHVNGMAKAYFNDQPFLIMNRKELILGTTFSLVCDLRKFPEGTNC